MEYSKFLLDSFLTMVPISEIVRMQYFETVFDGGYEVLSLIVKFEVPYSQIILFEGTLIHFIPSTDHKLMSF